MHLRVKEGDYLEITLRGKVLEVTESGFTSITFDGNDTGYSIIRPGVLAQAKITKLEPELKAGRAAFKKSGAKGRVLAVHEGMAWFRYDNSLNYYTRLAANLRNIPEDGQ